MTVARASGYVRLSKAAGDTNVSLQRWIKQVEEKAAELGLLLVGPVHVDDGKSGSLRDRPEFLAWLDEGTSGRAQVLIAPHTDRITRGGITGAAKVLEVVEGIAPGQKAGPVRLICLDGLDSEDRASFDMRFGLQAVLGKAELTRMRERAQAARKSLAEQGRYVGGAPPIGTRVVLRENAAGKLVKYLEGDEDEIDWLSEAAGRLLAGETGRSVVRWLNKSGHLTRRGGEWRLPALRVTLLSEATKQYVLDPATRRAVERLYASNPRHNPGGKGGRPQKWLLAGGNGLCGSCKRPLTTSRGRYVCSARSAGLTCSHMVTIPAEPVDRFLEAEYLRKWGDLRWFEERAEVTNAADLAEAVDAFELAKEAMLADPSPEAVETYRATQQALAEAESQPQTTRTYVVATDWTFAERWADAEPHERANDLHEMLAEPVVIMPAAKRGGRVDLARVDVTWMDEVEPVPDYREV
jgi:DNA invertase Pin-like site-specific DNA recombinase